MGFSGEPPGQSSDFFKGAFVQPPVSLRFPLLLPCNSGPLPLMFLPIWPTHTLCADPPPVPAHPPKKNPTAPQVMGPNA